MHRLRVFVIGLLAARVASAAVVPPSGYIYTTQLLGNLTQSCVAAGPGGTFVGIGPGFTANAQSVVLAKESGELRLVASGFNSIADCAYNPTADVLYVTDNADNGDFGISSPFAAQSGDTVFAIPSASTAAGLSAPGLELLPRDSVASAASVTFDASGNVFVSNSVGGGSGSVLKIVGSTPSTFLSGMDFSAGLAFNPVSGNLFAAQTLASFESQIDQYTSTALPVPPSPFAGPSVAFGSYDLAFNADGRLLATGLFGGDVISFNPADGTSTTFVSGLSFANGITVDPFTHRVQILSSTFSGAAEDKSLHRFTRIDELSAGGTRASTSECLHEAYGLRVVAGKATCTDGDPCDGDGKVNGSCLFPLGFCLNVSDPNFPTCSAASNITDVKISTTKPTAALAAASAQMSSALPLNGTSCFFSDGYYVPTKVTALGAKKNGSANITVKVTAADGRRDTDILRMVCQPAP